MKKPSKTRLMSLLQNFEISLKERILGLNFRFLTETPTYLDANGDIDYGKLPDDVIEDELADAVDTYALSLYEDVKKTDEERLLNLEAYLFSLICTKKMSDEKNEKDFKNTASKTPLAAQKEISWAVHNLYKKRMEICKKINDLKLDWLFIDGVIGEPHDESLFTHEYFIKTAQQRFDDFEEMVVGLLKKQHGDISESFVGEQFNWHELVGDETVSVENEFIPLLVSFLNEGEVKTIYEGIKNGEVVINIFNEPIIKVFEWICETKAESDYESEQEYESDKGNDAARGSLKFYKDENWASRKKMLNVIASHRLLNDLTISTQISVIKGMQQS